MTMARFPHALAALAAFLLSFGLAPAADHPSRDHGGADLVLEDGDRIWGVHENVGRFVIPGEVQVDAVPPTF